jgi:hypothetical protein
LISGNVFGQQISEYEAKAVFLIKIPNFIEWPEKVLSQTSEFIICIYGQDPIEENLRSKIKNSDLKIKNKRVIVKRITNIRDINNCHMLFITSSEKYELAKILKAVKNKPILTIGDTGGFVDRGVMIYMYIDETIKFKVNKISADKSGIYISSKLLVHAEEVIK